MSSARHAWPAIVVALGMLVGCTRSERSERAAVVAPSAASLSPAPSAPPAAAVAAAPQSTTDLIGWWRSDDVCLELFGNGDFQLSLMQRQPKIQVLGAATLGSGTGEARVDLQVKRIWKGRFVGPCRKTHETGDWIESASALGTTFETGKLASLTLKRTGDSAKLCGKTCVELARKPPALIGRWRHENLEARPDAKQTWALGQIIDLRVASTDYMSHVWRGGPGKAIERIEGTGRSRFVKTDTFAITFVDKDEKTTHELTATRVPDEKLRVCGRAGTCVTLARVFDSYHYDLE